MVVLRPEGVLNERYLHVLARQGGRVMWRHKDVEIHAVDGFWIGVGIGIVLLLFSGMFGK